MGGRDDEYYRGNVEQSGNASQNAPLPVRSKPAMPGTYLGYINSIERKTAKIQLGQIEE